MDEGAAVSLCRFPMIVSRNKDARHLLVRIHTDRVKHQLRNYWNCITLENVLIRGRTLVEKVNIHVCNRQTDTTDPHGAGRPAVVHWANCAEQRNGAECRRGARMPVDSSHDSHHDLAAVARDVYGRIGRCTTHRRPVTSGGHTQAQRQRATAVRGGGDLPKALEEENL